MNERETLQQKIWDLDNANMADRNTLQCPGQAEEAYSEATRRIKARQAEMQVLLQKLESLPQ